jgi:MFS family permease
MSAGPAVGGLVLDSLGWQWLFWLSVPVGLAAAALGWRLLPAAPASDPGAPFDWRGALLVGPAVAALVFALNHAADTERALVVTLAALALSGGLFLLLARQERRMARPLVDLRLFAARGFRAGSLAVILGYAMLYGMFFLMSFALEHGRGDNPAVAGLRLAVLPVAIGLAAPLAGLLSDRIGARAPAMAGMALCLFALVLLMLSGGGQAATTLAFASYGAGLGLFIAPTNHLTLEAAPPASSGQASAMLNLLRALGTSLGVAAATATLGWRLAAEGGSPETWSSLPGSALLAAVGQSLLLLVVMAAVATLAVLLAGRGGPTGRPTDGASQAADPPTVRPPISIDG